MTPGAAIALRGLRKFVARASNERCEMCSCALPAKHGHLVDIDDGRIVCACGGCGVLFLEGKGRYQLVTRQASLIAGAELAAPAWAALGIPVGLACIVRRGDGVFALYPGPAGRAEQPIDPKDWEATVRGEPALYALSHTDGILLSRLSHGPGIGRVSVDLCYELVARLIAAGATSPARVLGVVESVLGVSLRSSEGARVSTEVRA
jgi:hypothetical protein